jgi:hypothetical protein
MGRRLREFGHGQRIYLLHALGLLAPGRELPLVAADRLASADVSGWSAPELALLIEEGRRQSDRQQADLRDVRARAQWLFTVAVAALAALGAGLASARPGGALAALWIIGLAALVYGVGGAAAIMVARADFNAIHTAVLSAADQPVDRSLAKAYARMMALGENTVATRLTVLRQAVVWCLCGGYLGLVAALLAG